MLGVAICLWFDRDGEAAARHYVETFAAMGRAASLGASAAYGEGGRGPVGQTMTQAFTLDGQDFVALNGGPGFPHSPAASLMVRCADQAEIDGFWTRLSADPSAEHCGWLIDGFGLSWQVVPAALDQIMGIGDRERAARVMRAILGMKKLEIGALEEAARGV